ncbi:MAG: tRNA (adenosine(37)-N6)-threonylcarbamoyltransferase complex ATPase subunit type 1 TsaE [Clostridia bacterium]
MRYLTHSAQETELWGRALGAWLQAGDTVLLTGELGAGKSVLVRAASRSLGVVGAMPSPTFTLMQPYAGRVPVYHYDLYRLEGEDAFFASGLDEFLGTGVAFIEWPMQGLWMPEPLLEIEIARVEPGSAQLSARGDLPESLPDESARLITLTARGAKARMRALWQGLSFWEVGE